MYIYRDEFNHLTPVPNTCSPSVKKGIQTIIIMSTHTTVTCLTKQSRLKLTSYEFNLPVLKKSHDSLTH